MKAISISATKNSVLQALVEKKTKKGVKDDDELAIDYGFLEVQYNDLK